MGLIDKMADKYIDKKIPDKGDETYFDESFTIAERYTIGYLKNSEEYLKRIDKNINSIRSTLNLFAVLVILAIVINACNALF